MRRLPRHLNFDEFAVIKSESDRWDFFIAYASPDGQSAETLYELLRPQSRVFLDKFQLNPGDDWDAVLPLEQRKSLVTIALISPHSQGAHYQREEIAAGINLARENPGAHRVVPVFLDQDGDGDLTIPYGLHLKHGIFVSEDCPLETVADKLLALLPLVDGDVRRLRPMVTGVSRSQARFMYSIINASELANVGLVLNPYVENWDQTESRAKRNVRVYLWLPEPTVIKAPDDGLIVVAVCDTGVLEFDKKADLIDDEFMADCYTYTPSKLNVQKKQRLIGVIGEVFREAFVLAAVLPRSFIGSSLRAPDLTYQSAVNLVLLPLVTAYHNMGFEDFTLTILMQPEHSETIEATGKKMMKSAFKRGHYRVSADANSKSYDFYNYAARLIAWSVGRAQGKTADADGKKDKDDSWLNLLGEAFNR